MTNVIPAQDEGDENADLLVGEDIDVDEYGPESWDLDDEEDFGETWPGGED